MERTVKVKLDKDNPDARIVSLVCCGKRKWFMPQDLEPGYLWHCTNCDKLILVVDCDGKVHYAGNPVFK